jgi:hypothetical protein
VDGGQLPASDSCKGPLLSGINFHAHKAEHLFPVIPREVAESMQWLQRMRRLDCSDSASLRAE